MTRTRENSVSVAIRDSLLPKLVSGEFRVKDMETIVRRCM